MHDIICLLLYFVYRGLKEPAVPIAIRIFIEKFFIY